MGIRLINHILIGFTLLLLISSCAVKERIVYVPTKETVIEYVDKEIPVEILIQADTVRDTTTIVVTNGIISMAIRRLDTKLCYATIEIRSSEVDFQLYQKEEIIRDSIVVKEKITTIKEYVPVEVPIPLSWWERLYMSLGKWAFGVLSVLSVGSVLFFVGKIFFKLKFPFKIW